MDLLPLFLVIFSIRLISLFISIRNEKRLKAVGALEFGKTNTLVLTLAHIAYYSACLYEGLSSEVTANKFTYIGIVLFAFSMLVLYWVIYQLGAVWTVKLIIAPQHTMNTSFLFRALRHPNYFLNILPELVAIGLLCQAWYTLTIGFPLYLIPLGIRIYQEEKVMKETFPKY